MNFAKGLADGAFIGLGATGSMVGKAVRQDDGSVNRTDGVEGRDFARIATEAVAAVGALFRSKKSRFVQFLEYFRKQRERDVIALGNFLGAGDALAGVDCQVLEGYQSVVGFFGKFKHVVSRSRTETIRLDWFGPRFRIPGRLVDVKWQGLSFKNSRPEAGCGPVVRPTSKVQKFRLGK